MKIDTLEAVQLGDTTQWIRVRGTDPSNPVLLLIQQGPGLPMINESAPLRALLGLEKGLHRRLLGPTGLRSVAPGRQERHHRGSDGERHGVAPRTPPRPLRHEGLMSPGSPSGPRSASAPRHSGRTWWQRWWRWAPTSTALPPGTAPMTSRSSTARQRANKRAIRQLEAIGPPPHLSREAVRHPGPLGLQLRGSDHQRDLRRGGPGIARQPGPIVGLLGGDVVRTVRGVTATQAALLPELATLDLVQLRAAPRCAGRHGPRPPGPGGSGDAAQRYFDSLEAPTKELVWFENSAHTPHLEEPERYRELLMASSSRPACQHLSYDQSPTRRPTRHDTTVTEPKEQ
jgi:hypothetical protein